LRHQLLTMNVLSLRNVVKRYSNHVAVNNVSLDVPKGKIFGLLGPNGAGKTSMIRMITSITRADEGEIFIDGEKLNINSPQVIGYLQLMILDEPFSGLDPINTNLIKDEIHELNQKGTSIIFSTHRMEQVEQICEEIALIHQGEIILHGNVEEIKAENKTNRFSIAFDGMMPQDLLADSFSIVEDNEKSLIIQVHEGHNSNELLKGLIERGIEIKSYQENLPTLNEIFINKVGHSNE